MSTKPFRLKRKPVTALVAPIKQHALKSLLSSRGESIQDWLERLIDKEIKWRKFPDETQARR